MKTLFLFFFSTSLFASTWNEGYFPRLYFRVSDERLREIPPYAAQLAERAQVILNNPSATEEDGLVLIYNALMIMNNNKGVRDGVFKLSELRQFKSYTRGNDEEEMTARAKEATWELEAAQKLRPNDQRIPSWIASSKRIYSGDYLREALDAIALRPTFNLWTAILLFHTQDADTEMFGELALAGKKFVDAMGSSENPCRTRPEDCQSGPKAPYNLHASLVTLSDTFARRGEFLLKEGSIPEAMMYLSYAQGTLKQMPRMEGWGDEDVVEERAQYIDEMLKTRKPRTILLHETANFNRPYECSSCHGR